ncbi:uncharacterized [Tachysurus ichikawai]
MATNSITPSSAEKQRTLGNGSEIMLQGFEIPCEDSVIITGCATVTAVRDGEKRRDCTMWVKWSLSRGLWVTLSSRLAAVGLCGPPGQLCSSFLKPHVEDKVARASFSFLAGQACSSFQLYFRHTLRLPRL